MWGEGGQIQAVREYKNFLCQFCDMHGKYWDLEIWVSNSAELLTELVLQGILWYFLEIVLKF